MSDKKYNGWTNYETWNVALWLGNDDYTDRHWRGEATDALDDKDGDKDDAKRALSEQMKDAITEDAPELKGTYSDLLTAALGVVNWYEIAEHYVDDAYDAGEYDKRAEGDE